MLTIIHGEDIKNSRNYYLQEKEKQQDSIKLDGTTLTLTDLLQALSGNDLFANNQMLFIDELFSKRKPSHELDEMINVLAKTESNVFLWESKDLTPKQLSNFKNAVVKQFKLPVAIFAFVDALSPGNGKKLISLFHELLNTEDATFALVMMQRQIRLLLAVGDQTRHPELDSGSISENKRLAPWQKGKLQKQAKSFSPDQLIDLHAKLFALDRGQKTGRLSSPLDQEIDFFLLTI